MPRFVLLYHECPPDYERPSHWDLMLEAGGVLRTWALMQLPRDWHAVQSRTALAHPSCSPVAANNTVRADALGDHRLAYLDKEGPLSGNRGAVRRIDSGTYVTSTESAENWELTLAGALLRGSIQLRLRSPQWILTCDPES
jgi:hypothetical protein